VHGCEFLNPFFQQPVSNNCGKAIRIHVTAGGLTHLKVRTGCGELHLEPSVRVCTRHPGGGSRVGVAVGGGGLLIHCPPQLSPLLSGKWALAKYVKAIRARAELMRSRSRAFDHSLDRA
jgi:hypothetical protein